MQRSLAEKLNFEKFGHVTSQRGVFRKMRNRVRGKSSRQRPERLGSQGAIRTGCQVAVPNTEGSRRVGSKNLRGAVLAPRMGVRTTVVEINRDAICMSIDHVMDLMNVIALAYLIL